MAAPATHILLAEKIFDKYFADRDRSAFYVGTSFPDIRYLGVIDRDKIHFKEITLQDVLDEKSPFMAGVKTHSLVDLTRHKFWQENNMYSYFPESEYVSQGSKVYEDNVLYSKKDNWVEIGAYFDKIYDEELQYGIAETDIRRWHKYIQELITSGLEDESVKTFCYALTGKEMGDEIFRVSQSVQNTKELDKLILDFYDRFEELIA